MLTADCLPVLFSDPDGECVGAAHAGWQGLCKGILEQTIQSMSAYIKPDYAWLGPAIGPNALEVGDDVFQAYINRNSEFKKAFTQIESGKWLLNLYDAAKIVLLAADINKIYGGSYCTYTESERFFSYRRNAVTGRMATIIKRK